MYIRHRVQPCTLSREREREKERERERALKVNEICMREANNERRAANAKIRK